MRNSTSSIFAYNEFTFMQVSKKVPTSKHFHNYLNLILILENIVEPVD